MGVFVEVRDGHVRALAREQNCDGASDARIPDQGHHVEQLFGSLVVRRVLHLPQFEVGLGARLLQVLSGQRRNRIDARSRLHGSRCFAPTAFLIGTVYVSLEGSLALGRFFGLLNKIGDRRVSPGFLRGA